ncbi:MAG: prepilin-type N-terminal cleavage/methylation domain-containing protein [Chthoniobacteraceae bacterium]
MSTDIQLKSETAPPGLFGSRGGFTLIEVVLAVGIIAFALTAVFGLMGLAVQGTKDADVYARLGDINKRLVSSFQSQPFATVTNRVTTNVIATSYYDYYGNPLTDCYGATNAANTNAPFFRCDVSNVTPATNSVNATNYNLLQYSTNSAVLQIKTTWPYVSSSSTPSNNDYNVFSVLNTR